MYALLISLGYIIPLTFFIIGLIFYKCPPENINSISGYRTTRSMQNINAWKEGNMYSSKLLFKFSVVSLVIVTIAIILAGKSYDNLSIAILVSGISNIIFAIITIVLTERHLKDMFGL